MGSEAIIVFGVPAVAFGIACVIGHLFGRTHNKLGLGCIAGLWAAFTAMMFFGMEHAPGLDGIAYFAALIGISAPTATGLGLGGILGWMRNKRATYA